MSKNNFFAVLLAAAVVVGSVGCKKENENSLVNQHKAIIEGDALDGNQLRDLEFYTPEESTVNDKLLLFAKYMNEPEAYPMPNMEIKEAIWFSETFFNLGLVYKQEWSIKEITSEVTDFIDVPFEGTWGDKVVLKGTEFQLKYRELLKKIKARLSSEYVINFGDVFVKSVNVDAKIVTLGVRQKKGGSDAEKIPFIETMPLKIVPADYQYTYYPYSTNMSDKFPYLIYSPQVDVVSLQDVGMVATLNQSRVWYPYYASNIQKVNIWTNFNPQDLSSSTPFYRNPLTASYNYNSVYWDDIHYMYVQDYKDWGNAYKDYIWNTLWPSISGSWYGFLPYLADCNLKYYRTTPQNYTWDYGRVYHQYAIEYICQFKIGMPCVEFN